jgi:thymidylate synthase
VRGDYLDMMLVQRSGDMLTASGAGGINEIQYASLLMMIARHTGYAPGVFTHVVANEQIYDRHIDAAREMLNRFDEEEERRKVTMVLNPDKTNFYDMTIDDFILVGYEPKKPQLKLELGI